MEIIATNRWQWDCWCWCMMSLSYHESRKQPKPSRNIHNLYLNTIKLSGHLFGSDGFEDLDYVLNKAAEISIRVLSLFFFCDQCWFRPPWAVLFSLQIQVSTDRWTVNKTACSILWYSLSKFVLSLGSDFSRHQEGLSFRDTQRVWVFRVWGLSFRGLSFRDTPFRGKQLKFTQIKISQNVNLFFLRMYWKHGELRKAEV